MVRHVAPLAILSLGALAAGTATAGYAVQIATGGSFQRTANLLGLACLLLFALLLVPRLGIDGAATARAGALFAIGVATLAWLGRCGFASLAGRLLRQFAITAMTVLGLAATDYLFPGHRLPVFTGALAILAVMYLRERRPVRVLRTGAAA